MTLTSSLRRGFAVALLAILGLAGLESAFAADTAVPPGIRTVSSKRAFEILVERFEKAINDNKMGLVAQASASRGAAARGVKIPGNIVLMVFRNDFAVRMLEASVAAGIEAPLRIYITENPDGGSTVTYRVPSTVFSPYRNPALDALARELDPIFEKIVNDATGR